MSIPQIVGVVAIDDNLPVSRLLFAFPQDARRLQSQGMAAKYRLTTLGCKVNQYESQQISETLDALGWCRARPHEDADLVVVNTCAVTASALRKSRQAVRRDSRPGQTPVIVVGCGAAAEAQRFSRLGGVAATLDHDVDPRAALRQIVGRLFPPEAFHRPRRRREDAVSILSRTLPVVKTGAELDGRIECFAGHQRAFLKIQDGCDAHCTYCIIPRLRPVLRSKPQEAAVQEARALVASGHKEIVLTGIFLGAYARETAIRRRDHTSGCPLARLVQALSGVEGLERIRLSSLEPGDVDDALLEVLATNAACVPHLHLPLQSGSADVLRRMNRQYTREEYMAMVDRIRTVLDRPSITTDIIVGFPGETDADFEASLQIARYAEFSKIHAFPFSSREKTAAARWTSQFVQPAVVRDRMQRLADVERACSLSYRRRFVGHVARVLVEADQADESSELVHSPQPRADNSPGAVADNPSPQRKHGVSGPPGSDRVSGHGHQHSHYALKSRISLRHGRTDRYFEVHFDAPPEVRPGDLVSVRIDRVTPTRTHGTLMTCPMSP